MYEFCCPACGAHFDVRRSFSEGTDGVTCPTCASADVQRVFTPVAAFSNKGGTSTMLGASGCAGCAATHCAGCASARR